MQCVKLLVGQVLMEIKDRSGSYLNTYYSRFRNVLDSYRVKVFT